MKKSILRKIYSVVGLLVFIIAWVTFRVVVFDSKGKLSFVDYIVFAIAFLITKDFFSKKDSE